jgi:hypothetical protein
MKNLFKSLAEFQQEVPVIHKGTKGYGYSYADLPQIFSVINPLMKKFGLGFTQVLNTKEGITYIETTLFHIESGEMISGKCEIPRIQLAKMNEYQSFGSGITYFRRYCLASCLGLVTDVDQDGAGEQIKKESNKDPESEPKIKEFQKVKLSVPQFNKLCGAIIAGEINQFGEVYSVELAHKLFDLSAEQIESLKNIQL